jgi:hypothetical protein
MLKTYDGFFETLAVNIAPIFWSKDGELLKGRFPNMWKWMVDYDHETKNTEMRDQRNASVHRGGVRAVYPKHTHNDIRRRNFYPGPFWDNLNVWFPPLILELDDLIDILGQDLPNMPYLDTEEPPDGPSLITVAEENQKASDELASLSYDPYLSYLRAKYSFGNWVHRWMEWLGEKWNTFSRSWLDITDGWKLEETTYAGGKMKRLEAIGPPNPSQQPDSNDGSWGDQPSGIDVPIGDWADRVEDQPFEQSFVDQSLSHDGIFDITALQSIMWVQFQPVDQETPEGGRELFQRSRSNSAPSILSVYNVYR